MQPARFGPAYSANNNNNANTNTNANITNNNANASSQSATVRRGSGGEGEPRRGVVDDNLFDPPDMLEEEEEVRIEVDKDGVPFKWNNERSNRLAGLLDSAIEKIKLRILYAKIMVATPQRQRAVSVSAAPMATGNIHSNATNSAADAHTSCNSTDAAEAVGLSGLSGTAGPDPVPIVSTSMFHGIDDDTLGSLSLSVNGDRDRDGDIGIDSDRDGYRYRERPTGSGIEVDIDGILSLPVPVSVSVGQSPGDEKQGADINGVNDINDGVKMSVLEDPDDHSIHSLHSNATSVVARETLQVGSSLMSSFGVSGQMTGVHIGGFDSTQHYRMHNSSHNSSNNIEPEAVRLRTIYDDICGFSCLELWL